MLLAPPENDFALLQRFAGAGDEEAFAEIVRRYAGVVYAASFRVTHDRGRAEDVAQEVFFKLLRRPEAVTQSLGGWLHQCATRLALDDVRSESARKRREANRRIEFDVDGLDQQASTWQEISPHVDEALATLTEESRALLVSHFLQGKSQNAIAVETRTSPATISRRMREAVSALRAELKRKGVVVAPALLVGLCRMNAPAQAQTVPAALTTELGKMALVGKPAVAAGAGQPFAWNSVSSWCDAAARTWGWPAEIVKQAVAAAASTAVALAAMVMLARGFASTRDAGRPGASPPGVHEPNERHLASRPQPAPGARPTAAAPASAAPAPAVVNAPAVAADVTAPKPFERPVEVRVAPAGERGASTVVLFRWPETHDGPATLVYGDGRSLSMPPALARRLVENQAGKTLEQLAQESDRPTVP